MAGRDRSREYVIQEQESQDSYYESAPVIIVERRSPREPEPQPSDLTSVSTTTAETETETATEQTTIEQPSDITDTSNWTEETPSFSTDPLSFQTGATNSFATPSFLVTDTDFAVPSSGPQNYSSDESLHEPLPPAQKSPVRLITTPQRSIKFEDSIESATTAQTQSNVGTSEKSLHKLADVPVIVENNNNNLNEAFQKKLRKLARTFATSTEAVKPILPIVSASTETDSQALHLPDPPCETPKIKRVPFGPDVIIDALSGFETLPCNECDQECGGETAITATLMTMISEVIDSVVGEEEDALDLNGNMC